jgi:uncharacterized protein YbjT (DUF2867 family)
MCTHFGVSTCIKVSANIPLLRQIKTKNMKIIVTGSLGHISHPLVEKLTGAKHDVTVISSNAVRTAEIEALGAKCAVGSVSDLAFVTETFKAADAVYTMVPPTFAASDWKQHIASVGKIYAQAIAAAGVKNVVNLSSMGAHMPVGCGPVSGLYHVEQALKALEGVNVKHLRPGFFFYNFMANIGMIKHAGIIGGNYGAGAKLVLANPADIADAAAEELLSLSFTGKSIRYIVSDEKTTDEVASILGESIGKPDLKWVDFTDEATMGGMMQSGVPEDIAKNYTELGNAMRVGGMDSDYKANKPAHFGKTKFEAFAPVFAAAYSQQQ